MKPSEPVREQIRRMWLFSELSDIELDMVAQIAMRRQHERGAEHRCKEQPDRAHSLI